MIFRLRQRTKLYQVTLAWGSLLWSFQCLGYLVSLAERKPLATDENPKSLFQVFPATSSKISQHSAAEVFFYGMSQSFFKKNLKNIENILLWIRSKAEDFEVTTPGFLAFSRPLGDECLGISGVRVILSSGVEFDSVKGRKKGVFKAGVDLQSTLAQLI